MGRFSSRSKDKEVMDDLDCSGEVVHQTLHEIEFINKWLGGNAITLNAVKKILLRHKGQSEITIADLGCGGGGMLDEIDKLATDLAVSVTLIGIDANPNIIEFARDDHHDKPNIEFQCLDIFSDDFKEKSYDIILCTLVAHHFSDDQLVQLLGGFKRQARLGVVVNDLERNPLAYYSIKLLTSVFSKSKMVKFDAPLSVLRGFRRKELTKLLEKAGIDSYELSWQWAFRWKLVF